jgi:hypothetical protein
MSSPMGHGALERLEALLNNPAVYAIADAVPVHDSRQGGRPRTYPVYMWVVFDALLSIYRSARRVEAELAHPLVWERMRSLIRQQFPSEPDQWLPPAPMRRHHYLYGRTRYLAHPAMLDRLRKIHREWAARQALEIGLLNPDGDGSWTHPDLDRVVHADGKVITPLFRAQPGDKIVNKHTGEIRYPRADADAALHMEGTGEAVWGCKYVIAAVRGQQTNARIILDTTHVTQPGSEAADAVTMFTNLTPHIPGAQAVIYDGALRGVHHQTFLRHLGVLTVSRVAAAQRIRDKKGKAVKRIDKLVYVETKTVSTPTGPVDLKLFSRGGQLGLGELTDTGDIAFVPLERIRTHRAQSKAGTYRWYSDHRLPDEHGGVTITVRLHGNADDAKRKFNRTENVRPIPPDDPDFDRLYARRNDAESINRHLDDTLWLGRAHSIGRHRQGLNLLTYALCVNGLALHLHRRRRQPAAA